MSDKVIVSKSKLDTLADTIKSKSGATDNLTLDELVQKVNNIGISSSGNEQWGWALDNVINFSSTNSTFFKGNKYLKVMPNYFNEECAKITNWSNAFNDCSNLADVDIDTSAGVNFTSTFRACTQLTNEGIKNLNFNNMTNGFAMFGYGTKITQLPKFNHETITNMGEMFWASALSDLGEEDLSFPNVTNADYIFGQTQITKVPNLSLPKATTAKGLFQNCSKLNNFLQNLDIPKVTTVYQLFKGCTSLTEIGSIEAPLATASNDMFSGCTNLVSIGNVSLASTTNTNGFLTNCTNLKTIGELSVPKVVSLGNPFQGCYSLESIGKFDVSSATSLPSFIYSTNLKSIDFVNSTSKVTDFSELFRGKTVLETVKGLDLSSATNVSNMFLGCSNLKNVTFVENSIKTDFNLSSSSLLSDESTQSLTNGLATVETAQNLTIHSDVATKLTDEQKATISSKNWNIIPVQGKEAELEVTNANTLIAIIDDRQFTKIKDGLAIACTVTFGGYTGILLVSKIKEAVTYFAYFDTCTSAGSFTYNNEEYFYSSRRNFMSRHTIASVYPNLNKIMNGKTYTNDNPGSEEASTDLLNYYFNK